MRKGGIAYFSHNVFHSYLSLVCQDAVLCGNGLSLYQIIPAYSEPEIKKPNENIVENRENAVNQHFLLFPVFLPIPDRIPVFKLHLSCCLQML